MKKHERREALSEHLSEIDPALLDNAYAVDDAAKLKEYAKTKQTTSPKILRRTSPLLRVAAAVLCFAMVLGVAVMLINPFQSNSPHTEPGVPGLWDDETAEPHRPARPNHGDSLFEDFLHESVVFDSLDKVNYYGGLLALMESHRSLENGGVMIPAVQPLSMATSRGYTVEYLDSTETIEPSPDTSPQPGDEDWVGSVGSMDISGERMTITTAIYFELDVTEEHQFLADRIGTGRVHVVITDLEIGINPFAMITFKNGENYFSCLTEGNTLREKNSFWTHLYIKGFELFKDTTEGVSHFQVMLDPDTYEVESLTWIPYNRIPSEAARYPYDIVEGTSRVTTDMEHVFSLIELDRYFNPPSSDGEETTPVAPVQKVTVQTETESISPIHYTLWRLFYNYEGKCWQSDESDVTAFPSDDAYLPTLTLTEGEVSLTIEGKGEFNRNTVVYSKNQDGIYEPYAEFNGIIGNLDDLIPAGDWYVKFEIVWKDAYIADEYMYEQHAEEYWFKLVVVE